MRAQSLVAGLASLGIGIGLAQAVPAFAGSAAPSGRVVVQHSSPVARAKNAVGSTAPASQVDFNVGLALSDPAGAVELQRSVSDPWGPGYRHYLTAAQWESRFSPAQSSVNAVTAWLRAQGISVQAVSADRITIQASASAATVERAFGTSLGEYRHAGHVLRLANAPLSVPANIAPLITGLTGIDQNLAKPTALTNELRRTSARAPGNPIPQPEGFRNAQPCSASYGQKKDKTDPAYGGGYPEPLPYAVCGYTPPALQGAYGLKAPIANGIDGKGVTVAIVDAYAAPTLLSDAQQYATLNQPTQPLGSGQFSELLSASFNQVKLCEASEWFGEQTLDIEAVHATAPGAHILYAGAKNCTTGLYNSVQQIVDRHLADIITNSWGDNGGDVLDPPASRAAFDNVLLMAAGTGIGVQVSAGDEGDQFTNFGANVADYPPSSPYITAVGGTSLQVGGGNNRVGEVGWSTSKSVLCTPSLQESEYPGCTSPLLNTWLPPSPGKYLYGGGGGTSFVYPEPWYQAGIVPTALAARNTGTTGIANRVEPDISMDGDPTTGMLVGETQVFPDGTYYDQYRIGGTSLSSPLFAGVMADADQAAGTPLGFVNPRLYRIAGSAKASRAFHDIVPAALQANVRRDYVDGVDSTEGTLTSVRTLDYQGQERFCEEEEEPASCTEQPVSLNTAPGFDSMTGIGTPSSGLLAALSKP